MPTTMQLLDKALQIKRASHWANELNLSSATFTMAKTRGRLSPVLAGSLAIELGESPEHWMAIAAMEAEPDSPLLTRLRNCQELRRKLLLSNNTRARTNRAFSISNLNDRAYEPYKRRALRCLGGIQT